MTKQPFATRTSEQELTCALDHLEKARKKVERGSWSGAVHKAHGEIIYASNSTRHALELLNQKRED